MHIAVDANTGSIIIDKLLMEDGMMSVDMQGQETKQSLAVWNNETQALLNDGFTPKYEFYDSNRKIYIFKAISENI